MSSLIKTSSLIAAAAIALTVIPGCTLEDTPQDEGFFNLSGKSADIGIDELTDKMQKATDPSGAFKHCKTYIMRQTITYLQDGSLVSYTVEIKYKAPGMLRTSNYKNDKAFSSILIRDKEAWNIDPSTGKSLPLTGKALELVKNFGGIGRPGNSLKNIFSDIEIYSVTEKDHEYYKLVCYSSSDVAPYIFYVDKTDYLTKKLETTVYTDKGNFPYISVSSKFQEFDRVKMATDTFVTTGTLTQRYTTTEFKLNEEIPDSEFELPSPWYLNKESSPAKASAK